MYLYLSTADTGNVLSITVYIPCHEQTTLSLSILSLPVSVSGGNDDEKMDRRLAGDAREASEDNDKDDRGM